MARYVASAAVLAMLALLAPTEALKVPLMKRPLAEALQSRGRTINHPNGTVTLKGAPASAFYGTMSIGTPAQSVSVLFDSGSTDLAVGGPGCASCKGKSVYNPAASTTYKHESGSLSEVFGDGQLTGTIASDDLSLGGVTVKAQRFGVVTSAEGIFAPTYPYVGVAGLAWPKLGTNHMSALTTNWWAQNPADKGVFAMYMGSGLSTAGAELTIGWVDKTHYRGELKSYPLLSNGFWSVALQSVMVGSTVLAGGSANGEAAFDSGSSIIAGPQAGVSQFLQAIGATMNAEFGMPTVDCSKAHTLPDLTFVIGGDHWAVSPLDYVEKMGGVCVVLVEAVPGMPFWDLGDVFMRSVYTVFDMQNKQMQLAYLRA